VEQKFYRGKRSPNYKKEMRQDRSFTQACLSPTPNMMASGLLWYDDDKHRSLASKVAEAAQRYRERVGYEPTTCQLNPTLIPAATATKSHRGRKLSADAGMISLRLEPNEHLRPNYFYVGVLAGERLRRAIGPKSPQRRKPRAAPSSVGTSSQVLLDSQR
jgi:hypothetical protein